MNYMEQVAELLGVEFNERFQLKYSCGGARDTLGNLYCLTDRGVCDETNLVSPDKLQNLLVGDIQIVKLPWKPKENELAYYVGFNGEIEYICFSKSSPFCSLGLYHKIFYRTKEEAEVNVDKDMEFWDDIKKEVEER